MARSVKFFVDRRVTASDAASAISGLRQQSSVFLDLTLVREDLEKWFPDKELTDHLLEGLRKAGLSDSTDSSNHAGGHNSRHSNNQSELNDDRQRLLTQ